MTEVATAAVLVQHGRELAYREITGTGIPIMLIHGIGSSSITWGDIPDRLAATGAHVIVVDLPGHGQSSKQPGDYSLGALASALRDLIDHLGIARVHLVGHSLGGGVALQFSYQFPERVRSIVLVASGGLGVEAFTGTRIDRNDAITLPIQDVDRGAPDPASGPGDQRHAVHWRRLRVHHVTPTEGATRRPRSSRRGRRMRAAPSTMSHSINSAPCAELAAVGSPRTPDSDTDLTPFDCSAAIKSARGASWPGAALDMSTREGARWSITEVSAAPAWASEVVSNAQASQHTSCCSSRI